MYRSYHSECKYEIPQSYESATSKMSAFSLYLEEKLSLLDKRDRKIAEKCISDILVETGISAHMSADAELNSQEWNPYSVFNFGIRQQGSYNIHGQSYIDLLSKWFLIFSVVS